MALLLVACLICGLVLGTSFTAYVLLPASLISVVASLAVASQQGITVSRIIVAIFLGPIVVQAGYCVGHFCRPRLIDSKPFAFLGFGVR